MSTRRGFLAAAGLAGLAGLAAACSGDPVPAPAPSPGPVTSTPPVTTTTPPPASPYRGDAQAVALCAALSGLVADLYADAVDAAGRGGYGTFPGALGAFLQAAGDQHAEHAASWNALLVASGLPAVSGTLTVDAPQRAALAAATAPVDLAAFALGLESTVAATVTAVLGEITDAPAVALAAGVAPVAAMHAATVAFLLGRPVPAPADPTAGALDRDALVT